MHADPPARSAADRPLDVLMEVQELDTTIAQLRHRRASLPERSDLARTERDTEELAARSAQVRSSRDDVLARVADLQHQVDALEARRRGLEERMYGARGVAARDLQAMNEEVRHLQRRRSELEDAELEAMEEQEPLDAALGAFDGEARRLGESQRALAAAVGEAESVIDAELSSVEAARDEAAGRLPEDLVERYEALRTRLGGIGAARLVGNRCEGCHLELPAVEVDRIRRLPDDALVTCEQCGRILVRGSAPPHAG